MTYRHPPWLELSVLPRQVCAQACVMSWHKWQLIEQLMEMRAQRWMNEGWDTVGWQADGVCEQHRLESSERSDLVGNGKLKVCVCVWMWECVCVCNMHMVCVLSHLAGEFLRVTQVVCMYMCVSEHIYCLKDILQAVIKCDLQSCIIFRHAAHNWTTNQRMYMWSWMQTSTYVHSYSQKLLPHAKITLFLSYSSFLEGPSTYSVLFNYTSRIMRW